VREITMKMMTMMMMMGGEGLTDLDRIVLGGTKE
jgi:hypothetical protein